MRSQHDALPLPQVKHCAKSSGCSRAAVIGRGTFGDEEEGGRRKEEGGEDVRTWTKQVDISFPHLREPVHSEWHPLRYTRALV